MPDGSAAVLAGDATVTNEFFKKSVKRDLMSSHIQQAPAFAAARDVSKSALQHNASVNSNSRLVTSNAKLKK